MKLFATGLLALIASGNRFLAADAGGATATAPAPAASPAEGAAPAEATNGTEKAASRPRESVHSKEVLVDTFQEVLQGRLGHRVSKQDTWDIYKAAIAVSAKLAAEKPLSLAGVGRFHVMDSERSVRVGKPAKRLRFRASSAITACLNEGGDFLSAMTSEVEEDAGETEGKPAEGAEKPAASKASKPAGSKSKKTPAASKPAPTPAAAATPATGGAESALEDL